MLSHNQTKYIVLNLASNSDLMRVSEVLWWSVGRLVDMVASQDKEKAEMF